MKLNVLILGVVFIIFYSNGAFGYQSSPPNYTHGYLTNESIYVWPLIPIEIKQHAFNPLNSQLDTFGNYQDGEDMIIGAGEADSIISLGNIKNHQS